MAIFGNHASQLRSSGGMSRRAVFGAAALGAAGMAASQFASTAQTLASTTSRRFEGKVVLITGATSGIGAAAARAFAAAGALVGFNGRRDELGQEVEAEIRAAGGEATYIQSDVRVPEQVEQFVDQVVALYGGLDIAFNNAGIQLDGSVHEQSVDDWDETFLTNVRGVFLAMKYEIPQMLAGGGGTIVVTSSSATTVSRPNLAAYTASKDALLGLVRSTALDYGDRGIRINALLPGITDTPLVRPAEIDDETWAIAKPALGRLNIDGLKRIAEPEEIAGAALALASDDFAFMTGAAVTVDGGLTAGRPIVIPEL